MLTPNFWNCNRSKLTFCTKLAKMKISVVKLFVQQNFWTFKLWSIKVDFLHKICKNKHFNGKNIRPTEVLELQNNFTVILAMEKTQTNEIQQVPRSRSETAIDHSQLFCTKLAKMNISVVKKSLMENFVFCAVYVEIFMMQYENADM